MNALFVIDPPKQLDPDGDTSIALMRETVRRGGGVDVCEVGHLGIGEDGAAFADSEPIEVREGSDWYAARERRAKPLAEYDVVWMRKDPPFDVDYLQATLLLSHAESSTLMVNSAQALRDANEKLFAMRFPELCPETIVTKSVEALLGFRRRMGGAVVVKALDEAAGRGVALIGRDAEDVLQASLTAATAEETPFVIGQRYLPEVSEGDKRIIVVEGHPVGALLRIPQPGDFRANLHAGARPEGTTLTARDLEICEVIAPELRRRGIVFAGIDVIGGYLTEINITSPTCIREINRLDGVRLEASILDAVERRLEQRAQ